MSYLYQWKALSQTMYIGLEAHVSFVDFSEGHRQHKSPTDFPEPSSLINYDLVCLTAKIRGETNHRGIIFFKHMQETLLSVVFLSLIRWTEVLFSLNCFFIYLFFLLPLLKLLYGKSSSALKLCCYHSARQQGS